MRQPTLRVVNCAGTRYGELLLDCLVLNFFSNQFLFRFLETFDFLGTSTARMPPESPCRHLSDCLGQEAEQHGIFGKDEVDEVVDQEWNDVE